MATRSDRTVSRRSIADAAGIHINFITAARVDQYGWIELDTRGRRTPIRSAGLGALPISHQLTEALMNRLHINGGTWTSSATLIDNVGYCRAFIEELSVSHDLDDLTDPRLSHEIVWETILTSCALGSQQRNLRTLLADSFPVIRHDGETYQDYLYARSLMVDQSSVQGYAPEVADAIEQFVREHVSAWYIRHRNAVARALGHLPADWMNRSATELLERRTWQKGDFRVTRDDLAAAMVLLALADNKGPNLSTIQSYTADSIERANNDAAFATGVKARNREVLKTPAPAGGIFSYGGLLEFVTAATRVDRHLRQHNSDFDRLLFVASGATKTMDYVDVNNWWKSTTNDRDSIDATFPDSLSFRRLRKAALLRGKHKGHIIIGQKQATRRLYLDDALPEVVKVEGLLDTQAQVTAHCRSLLTKAKQDRADSYLDDNELEAAAAFDAADAIMDVGVAACVSNGQSPTDGSKPCGLGPIACFICPNGYRTPEVIPGLIAAVEFTDNIRKYEPTEWLNGDAPLLNDLAKKTLDQFPQHLVDTAEPEAIHNARALIACVYVETRTRD